MSKRPRDKAQLALRLKRGSKVVPAFENRLKLKQLYFGTVDANDELETGGQDSVEDFYRTFQIPEGLDLEEFRRGQLFLVYGLKGTGKTSFLRYLGERLKREAHADHELFSFTEDFPKEIYDDARQAYDGPEAGELSPSKMYLKLDYEAVWTYIILKRIAELTADHALFVENDSLALYLDHMGAIPKEDLDSTVFVYLPNIEKGVVRLAPSRRKDPGMTYLRGDGGAVSFGAFVKRAVELYAALTPTKRRFYLLFDEIEPRVASGRLFEMDSVLVRDLVIVLRRLNVVHSAETKSVLLAAAIRSEVLDHVNKLGKELHKHVEQFGFCMNWGDQGPSDIHHPLIRMVCEKIAYSERRAGVQMVPETNVEEYVWPRYFRSNRFEQLDPKVLLDQTWYRPRDLVRLLRIVRDMSGGEEAIREAQLSQARKRYADASWKEMGAQLTIAFDRTELNGLQATLTAFKAEFSLQEFEQRLGVLGAKHSDVQKLARHDPSDILTVLYRCGVVGNISGSGRRYSFRVDPDPDMLGRFCVHRGLLARFSLAKNPRQNGARPRATGAPPPRRSNRF